MNRPHDESEELERRDETSSWRREFTFIKTTYDISLDSQISLLPLGFSLLLGIVVVAVVKEGESCIATIKLIRVNEIPSPQTALTGWESCCTAVWEWTRNLVYQDLVTLDG